MSNVILYYTDGVLESGKVYHDALVTDTQMMVHGGVSLRVVKETTREDFERYAQHEGADPSWFPFIPTHAKFYEVETD